MPTLITDLICGLTETNLNFKTLLATSAYRYIIQFKEVSTVMVKFVTLQCDGESDSVNYNSLYRRGEVCVSGPLLDGGTNSELSCAIW